MISVSIGHSKTLAKLANHYAKKQPAFSGVCDFTRMNQDELDAVMETLPVSSVWGIGRRLEASLKALGVENLLRLKRANTRRIRDRFGITMQRTIQELNGEPWLELDEAVPTAKQVMSSRSFGERVESLPELREAISYHCRQFCAAAAQAGLICEGCLSIYPEQSIRSG